MTKEERQTRMLTLRLVEVAERLLLAVQVGQTGLKPGQVEQMAQDVAVCAAWLREEI